MKHVLPREDVALGAADGSFPIRDHQCSSLSCAVEEWGSDQRLKQEITCEEKNVHHEDKQQWNRMPRESGSLYSCRFSLPA